MLTIGIGESTTRISQTDLQPNKNPTKENKHQFSNVRGSHCAGPHKPPSLQEIELACMFERKRYNATSAS